MISIVFLPIRSQQVVVQEELKVTQMVEDENDESLVIHSNDGTLGASWAERPWRNRSRGIKKK